MTADAKGREQVVRWRTPVILGVVAFFVSTVLETAYANLGGLVAFLIVTPACCLALLVIAVAKAWHRDWKNCLASALSLVGYLACSWGLLQHSSELRAEVRWIWRSKEFKAEVLALPQPAGNELKHMEWEDFGALGIHTLVYLVYSPDDELRDYSPTHLSGLPCEVWRVHRLEKQWYAVKFYTDSVWPGGRFAEKACR